MAECPIDHIELPPPPVSNLTVCPVCKRSYVITNNSARLATGADTTSLSDDDLKTLRTLRGRKPR